ncbi:PTS sugar transporter subunit IIB [Enterococcus sp. LJL90]
MLKIGVFCVAGVSTAVLLHKLQNELSARNLKAELLAAPIADVFSKGQQMDVILLSPHARFNFKKVESVYPDKPILLMKNQDYQKMNTENIVNQLMASLTIRQAK